MILPNQKIKQKTINHMIEEKKMEMPNNLIKIELYKRTSVISRKESNLAGYCGVLL
jgi:hypothetical protein